MNMMVDRNKPATLANVPQFYLANLMLSYSYK